MNPPFSNHLSKETSPYLLQHAHNPVDWHPWGPEALQKAKLEDKPILVSIGYSACHWCHVMERESFEDPEIAALMNAGFVNIKIDREERPDLDHIYMDAVQAMTGSGGWPLNVFLTPGAKPFYGGTYFPKEPAFNRPSWKQILSGISESFRSKREEMESQGSSLTEHLVNTNSFGQGEDAAAKGLSTEDLDQIYAFIINQADPEEGGFGHAPKFPQTFILQFLLHYHYFTGNENALKHACLSLDKMIHGGIFDQLGGGFSRYSTDQKWLAPHFEKMLYDNALLTLVISEAYQLTGKDQYLKAIRETLDFVSRELLHPEGGFYSALDADSEGEEGKYYLWEKAEVDALLGEDSALFYEYMDIRSQGNWEGKNILHIPRPAEIFAEERGLDLVPFLQKIKSCTQKLFDARKGRVPPLTDDKILLGWNALMNCACSKAFAATGREEYRALAIRNMDFLWKNFRGTGTDYFHHSFKNGQARFPGFLDDYAFLIAALIQLQEITGNGEYLQRAKQITQWTLEHFRDAKGGLFYFTHEDQQDIILRKKEIYDGALPSGNSIMASNLLHLSVIFDRPDWKSIAISNCQKLVRLIGQYPSSFAHWATLLQAMTYTIPEIVLLGYEPEKTRTELLSTFIPFRVFQSATAADDAFPLLKDKTLSLKPQLYLCRDYTCQSPVTEVNELIPLLEKVQNLNKRQHNNTS
jgi:uncharacterized protein